MWPFTCTLIKNGADELPQEKLVMFTNPEFINLLIYLPFLIFLKK